MVRNYFDTTHKKHTTIQQRPFRLSYVYYKPYNTPLQTR